jgi:hypothetical protein
MGSAVNLFSFFSLIFQPRVFSLAFSASRFLPRVFRPAFAATQFFTFRFLMRFINYR